METIKNSLYRVDNTVWSYQFSSASPTEEMRAGDEKQSIKKEGKKAVTPLKEIRTHISHPLEGRHMYELVSSIAAVFEQHCHKISAESLGKGIELHITKQTADHSLAGKWHIQTQKVQKSWSDYIKQLFPFFHTISPQNIIKVQVKKIEDSAWKKVSSLIFSNPICPSSCEKEITFASSLKPLRTLTTESFCDPFTTLSRECLTSVERHFVMEATPRSEWRFAIDTKKDELVLKKITSPEGEEEAKAIVEENKAAVKRYKEFVEREYGEWFIRFLASNYSIDLDEMMQKGLPLTPDHVSRCNIGVLNLEFPHIETMYAKLVQIDTLFSSTLDPEKNILSLEQLSEKVLSDPFIKPRLAMRELRGIYKQAKKYISEKSQTNNTSEVLTAKELKEYVRFLVSQIGRKNLHEVSPSLFNQVAAMIMPSDEELERAFTGRKIRHAAIMGFHTMGNKNVPNPCRDMFELLHIFSDLKKTEDWNNFYELLGHVVAKKSLFRKTAFEKGAKDSWRVGLLIPGPNTKSGEARWYYNTEFVDDSNGNVNYTFLPASTSMTDSSGTHLAPMIKLYRSTASNRNAINWQDSLQADLNPNGSPGSLNPDVSYRYEKALFDERTIPLWVAYFIAASKLLTSLENLKYDSSAHFLIENKINDYFKKAVSAIETYFDKSHPKDKSKYLPHIKEALEKSDTPKLKEYFLYLAKRYKERPQDKKAQNIVFAGHSLGGALAQFGMYYFGTRVDRIPLPGCQFICYSSDGPAIDREKDKAFMEFGRTNSGLLELLGQRWKVYHQFEYGDFVPQAGENHLGTTGYSKEKDERWLDIQACVFRPHPKAEHIAITTAPTHGRRIGTAQAGVDYTVTPLTANDVHRFDTSWWLSSDLAAIFGYTLLRSPLGTEAARLHAAKLLYPVNRVIDAVVGNQQGTRDKNGVFYSKYKGAKAFVA